jgi:hypothetical protein
LRSFFDVNSGAGTGVCQVRYCYGGCSQLLVLEFQRDGTTAIIIRLN